MDTGTGIRDFRVAFHFCKANCKLWMNQNLYLNRTNFHMKGFALGLGLKQRRKATRELPISQSCTGTKSEKFWWATGQSNLAYKRLAATKPSRVWFSYSTQLLWPMEQSSILSAKFACPVARQNISLLATAHDCETDLSHSRLCAIRCLALKVRQ